MLFAPQARVSVGAGGVAMGGSATTSYEPASMLSLQGGGLQLVGYRVYRDLYRSVSIPIYRLISHGVFSAPFQIKSYTGAGGIAMGGTAVTSYVGQSQIFSATGAGGVVLGSPYHRVEVLAGTSSQDVDPVYTVFQVRLLDGPSATNPAITPVYRPFGTLSHTFDNVLPGTYRTSWLLSNNDGTVLGPGTTSAAIVVPNTSALYSKTKAPAITGGVTLGGSAITDLIKAYIGSGGLVLTGAATVSRTKAPTISGGVVLGGTAAIATVKSPVGAGGIVLGGTAAVATVKEYPAAAGGIQLGGMAVASYVPTAGNVTSYVGVGGIDLAGTALVARTRAPAVSGGVVMGGSALTNPSQAAFVYVGSGGVVLAGVATIARTKAPTITGGITLGGSASVLVTKAPTGSGGVTMGGSASVVWAPLAHHPPGKRTVFYRGPVHELELA